MDQKLNLLMLEDVPADAELVEHELRRFGFDLQMRRVETREGFVRELSVASADIILADYTVPDFGALEALQLLREVQNPTPLLLVTGSNSEEIAVKCMQEGAEDYVLKSGIQRLPAAVQRTLRKQQTERQHLAAEEALRRSEEQFRLITENTRDLICLLDLDGSLLYAAPSFRQVLGIAADSLLGSACSRLVHPDDGRTFKETLDESLFFHETRTAELRFRHADGHWVSFETAASHIFDEHGRPQRALLVSRDTTDRKRAEREIRKLAAFPRFNPNPVLEFAADGSLTYFNDAAQEMARSLKKNHPQSILPLNTANIVRMCLASGQARLNLSTNIAGRILSWSFFPVVNNRVVHCYAEDATDRLNLEAQLRQAQKMDSVGQLAAGVAHDFNNILTIIQGHAGLLKGVAGLDAMPLESARQISLAAERAANLTRQLLMFSRKQIMQPQLLNMNDVIENLSKMLRSLVGEPVELKRALAAQLPPIYADAGMMEQIIVNLSVNARDAMPRGGALHIATEHVSIQAEQATRHPDAREGEFVCLNVADTGHGMDGSTLSHIFEPFFTTKEIGKGTGLGLATVYGIVKQHQGWIEVESAVGRGTTFRIFLPSPAHAIPSEEMEKPKNILGGNETILVVEDETALRELVHEILEKRGYRVLEAANGVEAMRIWTENKDNVDLLLTDMMMPEGVSGRELAERILDERPATRVIYSSGYSMDVFAEDASFCDSSNFLQKPYDPETLIRMVRESLDAATAALAT